MSGSILFGSLGGLHIKLNVTWLLILPVLAISLALAWFPARVPGVLQANAWALGVAGTIAFALCILLHEYAHVATARLRGLQQDRATLYLFGGIAPQENATASPMAEVIIALAGPLVSLALGVLCWFFARVVGAEVPTLAAFLLFLGVANAFVGVFNFLPVFPLDGGRALGVLFRAAGERAYAVRWGLYAGEAVAALCVVGGAWVAVGGNAAVGVWLLLVGGLLLLAAQAADRQSAVEACFRDRTVCMAMNRHPVAVPASVSLQSVVEEYFLPSGLRAVAVTQIGELVGLVTLRDVHEWPREQWASTPVAYVMVPRTRLYAARPEERLDDALTDLARFDVNQLPVMDENHHLVGMLSRDIMLGFLGCSHALPTERATAHAPLRLPRAN